MAASGPKVIGRYALHDEIASGGMATVHLGRLMGPVGFSRTVAIKRLHPQFAKDPEFVAMFLEEARLAARIRHPNVVSTIDVVSEGEDLLLVLEFVLGESLSRLIRASHQRGTPTPLPIVLSIMAGALDGLHAAHEARTEKGEPLGIVHRDISPQNILVGTDGVARVLDFGVAKATRRSEQTRAGMLKGKVAYMPPEQIKGGVIDRRSDLYAASVVLWETLTNYRLFDGEDDFQIAHKILTEPVEPPSNYRPDIPPALDALVLRGLGRTADERFATALEMASALESIGHLASPREVSRWIEQLVGPTLLSRSNLVTQVESMPEPAQKRASASLLSDSIPVSIPRPPGPPRPPAPPAAPRLPLPPRPLPSSARLPLPEPPSPPIPAPPSILRGASSPDLASPPAPLTPGRLSVAQPLPAPPPSPVLSPLPDPDPATLPPPAGHVSPSEPRAPVSSQPPALMEEDQQTVALAPLAEVLSAFDAAAQGRQNPPPAPLPAPPPAPVDSTPNANATPDATPNAAQPHPYDRPEPVSQVSSMSLANPALSLRPARPWLRWGGLAGAVALLGLIALLWPRSDASPEPAATPPASASSSAAETPPPPPEPTEPDPPPSAPAVASSAPAPKTTSRPTATPPSTARKNCNPPFTIDKRGIKHLKPECF